MTYKHYKNTKNGNHCVQACLKTMLGYFNMPMKSFSDLDEITGHVPGKFTWMTKTLIWIKSKNLDVTHVENLDYSHFALRGEEYLKEIWDKETFVLQKAYSNLDSEQKSAKVLLGSGVTVFNSRMKLNEILQMFSQGYFTFLSVNPYTLRGESEYGSHMVIVAGIKGLKVLLCDPDSKLYWIDRKKLEKAISARYKSDFSATFVRKTILND